MISYRFLTNDESAALYQCFLAAFSDYLVDMRTTEEQFAQRLTRDGVELELSAGAFMADEMIGFYMNGLGSWQVYPYDLRCRNRGSTGASPQRCSAGSVQFHAAAVAIPRFEPISARGVEQQ